MERKRSEQRIREQAELLDQAKEGIVACSAAGEIGYANAGARSLLGKLDGGNVFTLLNLSEEQVAGLLDDLRSEGGAEMESALHREDGQIVNVMARWSRARDSGTAGDRELIAILADVTKRRKLNARLREAQKMESLGALAVRSESGVGTTFEILLPIEENSSAQDTPAAVKATDADAAI